jgi:hypothetical protein
MAWPCARCSQQCAAMPSCVRKTPSTTAWRRPAGTKPSQSTRAGMARGKPTTPKHFTHSERFRELEFAGPQDVKHLDVRVRQRRACEVTGAASIGREACTAHGSTSRTTNYSKIAVKAGLLSHEHAAGPHAHSKTIRTLLKEAHPVLEATARGQKLGHSHCSFLLLRRIAGGVVHCTPHIRTHL